MCPETESKRRYSHKTRAKAEAFREALMSEFSGDTYFDFASNPTEREVASHRLEAKRGTIKPQTVKNYICDLVPIVGPLLQVTAQERRLHANSGFRPHGSILLLMLGDYKVSVLAPAQLRCRHAQVRDERGAFTANRCMSFLKSNLALASEDYLAKSFAIPSNLPRRKHKPKKEILSPEEVAKLIAYAQTDKANDIYYAFPFLTGARVSEQLGLVWSELSFDGDMITKSKVQERSGETTNCLKTSSSEREVPIIQTLGAILLEWRLHCPRLDGELYRVFPNLWAP